MKLPEDKNPYSNRTPFDVLGVSARANSRELKGARDEKLQEIDDDTGLDSKTRIAKGEEIRTAYDSIRDPKVRVGIEIFFYDKSVGREECISAAAKQKTLSFDFASIIQGVEDIVPTQPEIRHAEKTFQPVALDRSLRLQTTGHRFATDPQTDALDSIDFER